MNRKPGIIGNSLALSICLLANASFLSAQSTSLHSSSSLAASSSDQQKAPREKAYARDRKMDIEHVALDVTPDFEKLKIKGRMTLTFHPIAKPMDELKLDAVDLSISKVTASKTIASYQVMAKEIVINFAEPISPDTSVSVSIEYSAQPLKGLYFRVPANGYPSKDAQIFSQGETEESRYWFPCFDAPNEKFTSELTCRVPDGMTVLSNGKLLSSEKDPVTKLTTFHWLQDKPHVNYLVTLVAGYFTSLNDQYQNIPLSFYAPPSDAKEAPLAFSFTKPIMEFFENTIGVPFPWTKYAQVVIKDFQYGGMENTSITTLSADYALQTADMEQLIQNDDFISCENLIAHEMAHQWFGDLITCKDWGNVWLNEGFATYYTLLFMGHKYGDPQMLYGFWRDREKVVTTNDSRPIMYREYDDAVEQIDERVYEKASLVLRMLHHQLGNEIFKKAVKNYLENNRFKNVVTQDFNATVEELSGRSFDRFFDQWVYHSGIPELQVTYRWNEKTKLATVTVKQAQKIDENSPAFHLPLDVRFKLKEKRIFETLDVKKAEEDFYVSLPSAPSAVLIDPDVSSLAKIEFSPGNQMLLEQLKDQSEPLGRVVAAKSLSDSRDDQTVNALKTALNGDSFVGVRIESAKSLAKIHNNEALEALVSSVSQSNPRARRAVMASLGKYYNPRALDGLLKGLETERNPLIVATILSNLGPYHSTLVQDILRKHLKVSSYRNIVASGALDGIRDSDDPAFVPDVKQLLSANESELGSSLVSNALSTVAYISRNEKAKDELREFITGYLANNNENIQCGAIRALGQLEDPKSISVLRTLAYSWNETRQQKDAASALQRIREANKPNDNLKDLRDEVVELQSQNKELKKDLDDLKKRLKIDEEPKLRKRALDPRSSAEQKAKNESASKDSQKQKDENKDAQAK